MTTRSDFEEWYVSVWPEPEMNSVAAHSYKESLASAWFAAKEKYLPAEYCSEHSRCLCGGDTEGVRRTCGNWVRA